MADTISAVVRPTGGYPGARSKSRWRCAKRQVGKCVVKGGLELDIVRAKLGIHAAVFDKLPLTLDSYLKRG